MKTNLILIGMPGAGKSTAGVILAKALGYDFLDVDLLIARRAGMPLQKILDTRGIDAFLEIEEREALLLRAERTVVATGGSMVLSERAMARLGDMGSCIYLDVPLDELRRRLTNMRTRGIAAGPGDSLEDIYRRRRPLYERYADLTIDCRGRSTEEVVTALAEALNFREK